MMENGWTERIEELEAEVAKLAAEWDADRRREYGYSQQTVDALTVERDKLEAERDELKKALSSVNTLLNPCGHTGFESNVCEICGYPDPRRVIAKLREKQAELRDERDALKADNERLWELLHKGLMGGVFFASDLVDEIKQALKEASHEG